MSDYTPGPWAVVYVPEGTVKLARVCSQSGRVLAKVGHPDLKSTDADARLIAAAPALVSAIRTALGWIEWLDGEDVEKAEKVLTEALREAGVEK